MNESDFKNFFSIANTKIKLAEDVRIYYGKEIAPDFNSFDFWWIDENKVSSILSFFLDPNQKHEQGDIYLKHFIRKFDLNFFQFDKDDKISVQCELSIPNKRRIDIAISKNSSEQVIAIENKIYVSTADQKDQLKDYISFLEQRTNDNYCLIYLSPQEKKVSTNSIGDDEKQKYEMNNKLKFLLYEENMIDCINEFSLLTDNIRVKSFIKDFEKTLRKMYMGENNINSKQVVIDFINENEKNLEISFLVSNSLQEVKKQLLQKFKHQISEIGNELSLEVEETKLKPSNWKNHMITFSFESGGVLYGITRKESDNNKTRFLEIEDLLEQTFKDKFNVSAWWALYQFIYRNIDQNPQFWLDIHSGKAKNKAKEFVNLINNNFNTDKY